MSTILTSRAGTAWFRKTLFAAAAGCLALTAALPADARPHDTVVTRRYYAAPATGFTLSFGTGYAGRGYYYGPPGASYYYQRPGVRYYRNREMVPQGYLPHQAGFGYRTNVAVQRALGRRGYYRGPLDGDIGPGSRHAIAAWQRDNGLRVTGTITPHLLRSLRLD